MIGRIFRNLFGFLIGCLAAGLALVLFVHTPAEFPDWPSERFIETGMLALAVGTQAVIFAAPFAFIGTALSEWRGFSGLTYHLFLGALIGGLGFAVQYAGESGGPETIVNTYALTAFIVSGVVGGFVYWLLSGHSAGAHHPKSNNGNSEKPLSTPFAVKKPDTATSKI